MNAETGRKSSQSLPDAAMALFKNLLREGRRGEKSESSRQRWQSSLPPILFNNPRSSLFPPTNESASFCFPLLLVSSARSARFSSPFCGRSYTGIRVFPMMDVLPSALSLILSYSLSYALDSRKCRKRPIILLYII